jgi:hypothetical protein
MTTGPDSLREYCKIIVGPNAAGVRKRILEHVDAWEKDISLRKAIEKEARETFREQQARIEALTERAKITEVDLAKALLFDDVVTEKKEAEARVEVLEREVAEYRKDLHLPALAAGEKP